MKKVLFTATVDSHILHFHVPYLKWFKEQGYEVHVATNGNEEIPYCDVKHKVTFERSPIKINNLKAIKQLKKIINNEKFDIIHCHTPMGSVVTRLAAMKARKKNNTKVIYTAHGFHFFKGAPIQNWLIFYPIEKILSYKTDCLITINQEDYNLAKNKFHAKTTKLIYGVGIDKKRFDFEMTNEEKNSLKKEFHLNNDDFVIVIVGELNKNKNQIMAIEAMRDIVKQDNNIKLLLVGKGELEDYYKEKVKEYNLENNIIFAGYRKDVHKILKISNLLLSLSKREGLPVNVIEAMFCNLPIIATDCRGNRDLVENTSNEISVLKQNIMNVLNKKNISNYNVEKYELNRIIEEYEKIYLMYR